MNSILNLLKEANSTVIFTGAGMSTESGLPDFRSKDRGLWEKSIPVESPRIQPLLTTQEEFPSFTKHRFPTLNHHRPLGGPSVLPKTEQQERLARVTAKNKSG